MASANQSTRIELDQSEVSSLNLSGAGWALPGRPAPPPAPRKPEERRTKMAEGEINIDNIIQRLLEGEMSTIELALFSSSTSWTLK